MKILEKILSRFGFLILKKVKNTVYKDINGTKYGVFKR